ncbi:MAG: hypothetical protein QXK18_01305 [Candidatus Bathyarchaeia archaeon]
MLPVPVGWDTPRYIWQMRAVTEDLSFIAKLDFNNFVYIAFGSLFVRLGGDAFIVERVFPPILLFTLLIEAYFILTKLHSNRNWKIYTTTILSWFGAFRVASDLHNNLLALNALFLFTYLFHLYFKNAKKQYLGIAVLLLFLSSFIHLESTLFLLFISVLSLLTEKNVGKIWKISIALLLLISVLPAAIFYYIHIKKLLSYSGGSFRGSVMEPWRWLVYLGPAGFIGVYQLISEARFICMKDFLERSFMIWGFASIIFGLIQYLEPSFMIFSERAIALFPTPFLAIHKIEEANHRIIHGIKSWRKRVKLSIPVLAAIFNLTIVLSMNFYNISISSQRYEKILFLKQKFHNEPIIMVVDYSDRYAGEFGQHFYNWGKAVIGNVYTYIGSVYYLRDLMPTPFFHWSSRQASNILFQEIRSNFQSLDEAIIIYGLDFTDFPVLPRNFEAFMEPLDENLYMVNITKLRETSGKFILPVFQHSRVVSGVWWVSSADWSDYQFVSKCYIGSISQLSSMEVLFAVNLSGNYTVNLKYYADVKMSFYIQVDNSEENIFGDVGGLGKITVYNGFLSEGEHLLKISLKPVFQNVNVHAYLDVLEIQRIS